MTHGPLSWRELVERDKQKSEDAHNQIKRAAMPVQADPVPNRWPEAALEDWDGVMVEDELRAEITRLTEALRAAEERERVLREALEPFAKCCEDWISDDEDDEEWAKFRLLIKDYRRASVAMKEQGHGG